MGTAVKRKLSWGLVFAILAVLPLIVEKTNVINFLFLVFLFIALSQSWNILGGYTGQVNLGHAAFFGLGALITRHFWFLGLPFILTLLLGGTAALIFAFMIGFPAFRLKGAYFVIGMLAMAEIIRIVVGNALPSISTMPVSYIAEYSLIPRYYLALIIMTAVVISVYVLNNSKPGLAMVAIRQDEDTAEAAGVNALKYKLMALALSSFIAGLCGGIFAFFHVSYYPAHPFSVHWTFDALFIAYIGGIGTVGGPIVGAIFYIGLREILPFVLPQEIHTIVFGILFILVILLLPRGLIHLPERVRRVLKHSMKMATRRPENGIQRQNK